jgi:hypothetical protein
MKKSQVFYLMVFMLFLSGCAVQTLVEPVLKEGTAKLEIPLSNECLISLENAKLSSEGHYAEGTSPVHTTTKKVFFADYPCNTVTYEYKSFGSGRWYFLTKVSEQAESLDRSCSTETIQGLDFTSCSNSWLISTQSAKHSGYDNRKILYLSNRCFGKIKDQFKVCQSKNETNVKKWKPSPEKSLNQDYNGLYEGQASAEIANDKCSNKKIVVRIMERKISGKVISQAGQDLQLDGTAENGTVSGIFFKDSPSNNLGNYKGVIDNDTLTGTWEDKLCKGSFILHKGNGY